MRVLWWFTKLLLLLMVISLGVFLIGRELLLGMAVSSVNDSIKTLRSHKNSGSFNEVCLRRGSKIIDSEDLVTYQIRFTSNTDYLLEAVCAQFEFDPVLIEKKSLPKYISKAAGSSGFYFDSDLITGIELRVFADLEDTISKLLGFRLPISKSKWIALENNRSVYPNPNQSFDDGPVTNCEGYGFKCCNELTEMGVGKNIIGLEGCPNSCYSSCTERPSLLSFSTSPYFNPQKRVLEISQGSGVEFHYVVGNQSGDVTAHINFGDGESVDLASDQTSVPHRYQCNFPPCEYQATIELVDQWGVKSSPSSISQIKIKVL